MSFPKSNTSNTPDYDIDLQPQDLSRRMHHLSNVLNHFWKSWRNEHLIKLQNAHYYRNQNDTDRTEPVGDVVVVHQDEPRRKWCVGKTLDLVIGSNDCSRGVVVQVRSEGGKHIKLRRPVQRLYPLEIQSEVSVQQITEASSGWNPDLLNTEVRTEQPVSTWSFPKRTAPIEADQRRKTTGWRIWLNKLSTFLWIIVGLLNST